MRYLDYDYDSWRAYIIIWITIYILMNEDID